MQRKEAIEKAIVSRWGENSVSLICKQILDYVATQSNQPELMMNFADLHRITGQRYTSDNLQRALAILISRFSALELGLVYFDEVGKPHYLDNEQKVEFVENGYLADPISGKSVENAAEHTFPYYLAHPRQLTENVPE